jgi:hypothetical protein
MYTDLLKTGEKVAYKTGEKVVVTGQENRGMFDCKGYQIRKALIIISTMSFLLTSVVAFVQHC